MVRGPRRSGGWQMASRVVQGTRGQAGVSPSRQASLQTTRNENASRGILLGFIHLPKTLGTRHVCFTKFQARTFARKCCRLESPESRVSPASVNGVGIGSLTSFFYLAGSQFGSPARLCSQFRELFKPIYMGGDVEIFPET